MPKQFAVIVERSLEVNLSDGTRFWMIVVSPLGLIEVTGLEKSPKVNGMLILEPIDETSRIPRYRKSIS